MKPRYPSLSIEIFEHIHVSVKVDLSCPTRDIYGDRLRYSPGDVIELITVQVSPIVLLRPVIGAQ